MYWGQIIMSNIDYEKIYKINREGWKIATEEGNTEFEELISGHYTENNHFIYELIQNAEDAEATKMFFKYYEDRLEIYHDGRPFTYEDVLGICSLQKGTKDRNDMGTIGKFGLGFKSVFRYTSEPYIYCNDDCFYIERYMLPIENRESKWNYKEIKEKIKIEYDNKVIYPFKESENLTCFTLKFKSSDKLKEGLEVKDIIEKIIKLECEISLFLKNIKYIYWIDNVDTRSGYYSKHDLEKFDNGTLCKKYTTEEEKTEIKKYLLFDKKIELDEMKNAEIKIAYKLNEALSQIEPCDSNENRMWVYFPTNDLTNLKFIIHGSYQTPVSREHITYPSKFNDILKSETENLILESLFYLKNNKLLTQKFITELLLPSTKTINSTNVNFDFRDKLNKFFREENLFPNNEKGFCSAENLRIPVPISLSEIVSNEILSKMVKQNCYFADIKAISNNLEYYNWLTEENEIKIFNIEDYAKAINFFKLSELQIYDINDLYMYLSKKVIKDYSSYSGKYKNQLDYAKSKAKIIFRKAKIILTKDSNNELVSAYDNEEKPNVYLYDENRKYNIPDNKLVNENLIKNYYELINWLEIAPYNSLEYIKNNIINKYIGVKIKFNTNNIDLEHVEDIRNILMCIEEGGEKKKLTQELIKKAQLIKIKSEEKKYTYPDETYFNISQDNISIENYFDEIEDKKYADYEFYSKNGISYRELKSLGVKDNLEIQNSRDKYGVLCGQGSPGWNSLGEFLWNLDFYMSTKVISFIENNHRSKFVKCKNKSIVLFNLVRLYYKYMSGIIEVTKNKNKQNQISDILLKLQKGKWLFSKDGGIHSPNEISRYDLDLIYNIVEDKEFYKVLGFIKSEEDYRREKLKRQIDNVQDINKVTEMIDVIDTPEYSILIELRNNPLIVEKLKENPQVIIDVINRLENEKVKNDDVVKFDVKENINTFLEKLQKIYRGAKINESNIKEEFAFLDKIEKEEEENLINTISDLMKSLPTNMTKDDLYKEPLFLEQHLREFLSKNYKGRCQICGAKISLYEEEEGLFFTYRHVKRESRNIFANFPSNALCLCPNCHNELSYPFELNLSNIYIKVKEYIKQLTDYKDEGLECSIISLFNSNEEVSCFKGNFIKIPITINNIQKNIIFTDEHFIYIAITFSINNFNEI